MGYRMSSSESSVRSVAIGSKKIDLNKQRVRDSLELISVRGLERLAEKNPREISKIMDLLLKKYKKNNITAAKLSLQNLSKRGGNVGNHALIALDNIKEYEKNRPSVSLTGKSFCNLSDFKKKKSSDIKNTPNKLKTSKKSKNSRRYW